MISVSQRLGVPAPGGAFQCGPGGTCPRGYECHSDQCLRLKTRRSGTSTRRKGMGDPLIVGAIAGALPGILGPIERLTIFFAGGDERAREQQLRAREQQIRAREAEFQAQEGASRMQAVLVIGGGALLLAGLAVVLGTRKKAIV